MTIDFSSVSRLASLQGYDLIEQSAALVLIEQSAALVNISWPSVFTTDIRSINPDLIKPVEARWSTLSKTLTAHKNMYTTVGGKALAHWQGAGALEYTRYTAKVATALENQQIAMNKIGTVLQLTRTAASTTKINVEYAAQALAFAIGLAIASAIIQIILAIAIAVATDGVGTPLVLSVIAQLAATLITVIGAGASYMYTVQSSLSSFLLTQTTQASSLTTETSKSTKDLKEIRVPPPFVKDGKLPGEWFSENKHDQ